MSYTATSSERGVSLFELIIVMAIFAIVVAGMVTGFRSYSKTRAHQEAVSTANAEIAQFLTQFKRQWLARARTNATGQPILGFQSGSSCKLDANANGCPSLLLTVEDSVRGNVSVPIGSACSSISGSRATLDYAKASDCLRCTGSQAPRVALDTRNLSSGGRTTSFPTASKAASSAAVSLSACFVQDGTTDAPLNVIVQAGIVGQDGKLQVVRKSATLPIDNFADVPLLGR